MVSCLVDSIDLGLSKGTGWLLMHPGVIVDNAQ